MTGSANYLFLDIPILWGDGMTMNVLFRDVNTLFMQESKVEKGKNILL